MQLADIAWRDLSALGGAVAVKSPPVIVRAGRSCLAEPHHPQDLSSAVDVVWGRCVTHAAPSDVHPHALRAYAIQILPRPAPLPSSSLSTLPTTNTWIHERSSFTNFPTWSSQPDCATHTCHERPPGQT